ncbi:ABC transporter ATP-binding protein [Bacillus sp. ISL-51]|uniref:ABC transporter ATP-binding protein n=1 Tax=Bacteria TaxID=2 RepID=UPI001BEA71DD|nr:MULTISPECIES: ABC transporter ATP-binding protein [Bacteria]MBT2575546.1 ABC transporter ATP-binding protein [Bacillus sp. ISL-51]MBT2635186.1 ABC transporter ATP-binding protein [Bacillus sp. ISL-26]MBT2711366.1 ABC transporter ATP-binding protein [Pseudomonas sp. ISL-88]
MGDPLLEVNGLKKYYEEQAGISKTHTRPVKAVDGVSFTIGRGEVFGLAGESGSGKSSIGKTILRLQEKTGGDVYFQGRDVFRMNRRELKKFRSEAQLIFQDPFSSLNPRRRIGEAIGEAMIEHQLASKRDARDKAAEVLEACGLSSHYIDRYPHEFSGGQRQRIVIARAMALEPQFIIMDEPVAALDVSIQAQMINLFSSLQKKHQLSYLFISHDLSVVEHLCTKIAIMYLGTIVEYTSKEQLFSRPLHPYTQALLSAVPIPDPGAKRERIMLKGDIPSPSDPPSGCKFRTRCPAAKKICAEKSPILIDKGHQHYAACHFV